MDFKIFKDILMEKSKYKSLLDSMKLLSNFENHFINLQRW